ncbi:class I SAM-dependent methyltransferase, partial [bacterium]|nr:class I SAM-dependent methyltransferase [bacterium]
MSMFTRNAVTYEYDQALISYILQDDANPLKRICEIIPSRSKVLDVGAGNGLLAVVMKTIDKGVIIDGIEPNPHAASIAKAQYRFFWTGYVQDFKEVIQRECYDYIVMADVIEHFQDPQLFLESLVSWIPDETKIVLSIPNIAFGAVRLDLLKGNFRYVDSGILEKTHLRFFTIETLRQLVSAIGLSMEKLYFLQRNFLTTDIQHNMADVGWRTLFNLMKDEFASTYQFIVVLSHTPVTTEQEYYGIRTRIRIPEILMS